MSYVKVDENGLSSGIYVIRPLTKYEKCIECCTEKFGVALAIIMCILCIVVVIVNVHPLTQNNSSIFNI